MRSTWLWWVGLPSAALLATAIVFFGARRPAPPAPLEALKATHATAQSRYVDVAGAPIHYMDEGQGPVLLMLHGSFGNLHTFDDVAAELRGAYRIVRLDQPPAGLSGPVPEGYTLTPEQFVAAFLDAVGIERVALLATSSGGILAYRFAATYPQRTTALVLSNVPPSAPVDNPGALRRNPWLLRQSLTVCLKYSRPWSETCVRDFLRSTFHRQERITPEVVRQYYDFNRRPDSRTPSSMTGIMRDDARVRDFLSKVTAPTLLVWGAEDHVLPTAAATLLVERLTSTRAQLQILDDVAHYPPLEAPREFAAASREFLAKALTAR